MNNLLEFYGGIKEKIAIEGLGYYITSYESENTFDIDPVLKQSFIDARQALNDFELMIDEKIKWQGGNPNDYQS